MSQELFQSLTKDMSKGVARLAQKPDLINSLSKKEIEDLQERIANYSPKTEIGRETKLLVANAIYNTLETGEVIPKKRKRDGLDKQEMIEKRSAVLFLKIPQPGFTKCVDTEKFISTAIEERVEKYKQKEVSEDIDSKRHKVVQFLYGKDFLKPLVKQRTEFFAWLDRHAVPSTLLSADNYLVPTPMISEVIDRLAKLETERNTLLDNFKAQFPQVIEDAKKRLGDHFDIANYADFDSQVRERFYPRGERSVVKARWRSIEPSEALKEISKSAYEKERELSKVDWEDTFGDIRDALRAGFVDLVGSFTNSLGTDENGKPKVFHASKVEHLKDFINTFAARDLTNDEDLEKIVAQATEILETADPASIRKDKDFRKNLEDQFEKIKTEASKLTVVRTRKLNLDDE